MNNDTLERKLIMRQLGFVNHAVEWESILMGKWLMIYEYTNTGSPASRMRLFYGITKIE